MRAGRGLCSRQKGYVSVSDYLYIIIMFKNYQVDEKQRRRARAAFNLYTKLPAYLRSQALSAHDSHGIRAA
jgi:hypothetical protein